MKQIIKHLTLALAVSLMAMACSKKDEPLTPTPPTTPAIKLGQTSVSLEIGATQSISISGGKGSYTISPSTSAIASLELQGNTLVVTGKAVGSQTFVISSADVRASLEVKVTQKTIPSLSSAEPGVYGQDLKLLFVAKLTYKTKEGIWLVASPSNPYEKRIFLPYYGGGETLEINSSGLAPHLEPGKKTLRIVKEKDLEGRRTQLLHQESGLRFVVLPKP